MDYNVDVLLHCNTNEGGNSRAIVTKRKRKRNNSISTGEGSLFSIINVILNCEYLAL